jgi:MFS family permease
MLVSIIVWVFAHWLPLYFTERFQMNLGGAGFAGTGAMSFGAMVGVLGGGLLSDRVARRGVPYRLLLQGLMYFAAIPFLLMFIGTTHFGLMAFALVAFSVIRAVGQANEVPTLRQFAFSQLVYGFGFAQYCQLPCRGVRYHNFWLSQTQDRSKWDLFLQSADFIPRWAYAFYRLWTNEKKIMKLALIRS